MDSFYSMGWIVFEKCSESEIYCRGGSKNKSWVIRYPYIPILLLTEEIDDL